MMCDAIDSMLQNTKSTHALLSMCYDCSHVGNNQVFDLATNWFYLKSKLLAVGSLHCDKMACELFVGFFVFKQDV